MPEPTSLLAAQVSRFILQDKVSCKARAARLLLAQVPTAKPLIFVSTLINECKNFHHLDQEML